MPLQGARCLWRLTRASLVARASSTFHTHCPLPVAPRTVIFPRDLCEPDKKHPDKPPPTPLEAGEVDTTHHEKFATELLPGDERYLYDNSGAELKLYKRDVIPSAVAEPVGVEGGSTSSQVVIQVRISPLMVADAAAPVSVRIQAIIPPKTTAPAS